MICIIYIIYICIYIHTYIHTYVEWKVKNSNCHKNKMRANEPKIWKNNKNTVAQPKLSGSYKN